MGVSNALCGHFDTLNELKSTIEYCFYGENESSFSNKKREEYSVVVANTTKITFKKGNI